MIYKSHTKIRLIIKTYKVKYKETGKIKIVKIPYIMTTYYGSHSKNNSYCYAYDVILEEISKQYIK